MSHDDDYRVILEVEVLEERCAAAVVTPLGPIVAPNAGLLGSIPTTESAALATRLELVAGVSPVFEGAPFTTLPSEPSTFRPAENAPDITRLGLLQTFSPNADMDFFTDTTVAAAGADLLIPTSTVGLPGAEPLAGFPGMTPISAFLTASPTVALPGTPTLTNVAGMMPTIGFPGMAPLVSFPFTLSMMLETNPTVNEPVVAGTQQLNNSTPNAAAVRSGVNGLLGLGALSPFLPAFNVIYTQTGPFYTGSWETLQPGSATIPSDSSYEPSQVAAPLPLDDVFALWALEAPWWTAA
jgi:hypothetical protein